MLPATLLADRGPGVAWGKRAMGGVVHDDKDVLAELLARVAQLERQVERLTDERMILELLARYGFNADLARDEEWLALWTADGRFEVQRPDDFHDPALRGSRRFDGADGLRAFITDPEAHHGPGYGRRIHVQALNPVIHIDGAEAVVNDNWMVLLRDEGQVKVLAAGNDQWRVQKVDGQWRFVERRICHIGSPGYLTNVDATPD